MQSLHDFIELLADLFDFWSILIRIAHQRLREGLVRVLRCVARTWDINRRLRVYFLYHGKLLYIIRKRYLLIIVALQEHSCSSTRITIRDLLATSLFGLDSRFLGSELTLANDVLIVQVYHGVLVELS